MLYLGNTLSSDAATLWALGKHWFLVGLRLLDCSALNFYKENGEVLLQSNLFLKIIINLG
jgi:hypothetical protein